jgi:hypothetical protein
MGNKSSKEGGQKIEAQDKIPSESSLGKMSKYWDDNPHTKGKKNKEWLNTVVLSGHRTDLKAFGCFAQNLGLTRTESVNY